MNTKVEPDAVQSTVSGMEMENMNMSCSIQPRNIDIEKVEFPGLPEPGSIDNKKGAGPKVCIVTQDIVGPIRNGGIGTAYRFVAELLSKNGMDVTILYALGDFTENKRIDYWVSEYKKLGITFVPMPDPEVPNLRGKVGREMTRAYGVYEWLKHQQFDIVHASEWKGLSYYCLVAKNLGIAFPDTLFCIKASSPSLWNLEGNAQLLKNPGVLITAFIERKSIELADVVVSGSKYMLQWMMKHGYQLPSKHVYVQPNIILDAGLEKKANNNRGPYAVEEMVFFGRLEPRKGLHLFCDAINRLKRNTNKPFKVTFLGKHAHAHGSLEVIEEHGKNWSFPWKIIDNLDQPGAITYLSQPGRVAVMPSMSDNSPFGVYECLANRIPFITSNVGGGPELIAEHDRGSILFDVRPTILARRLLELLENGIEIADPCYDFGESNQRWLDWHRSLANGHRAKYLEESRSHDVVSPEEREAEPLVTICIPHHNRHKLLAQAIESVQGQTYRNFEVVLVDDGSDDPESLSYLESIAPDFAQKGWRIEKQENLYPGAARNNGARMARGKYIYFLDDDNYLKPGAISVLVEIAERSGADMLTCFSEVFTGVDAPALDSIPDARITLVGDIAGYGLIANGFGDGNAFIRRESYIELGGHHEDYGVGKDDQEFYTRAVLKGYKLYQVPQALYWYRHSTERLRHRHHSQYSGDYKVLRAYLDALPHFIHPLILLAQGQAHAFAESSGKFPKPGSEKNNEQSETFIASRPLLYRLGRKVIDLEIAAWNRFLHLQLLIASKIFRLLKRIS